MENDTGTSGGEGARVFLVEDEPLVRDLARSVLTEKGFVVTEASSVPEARARAATGDSFDLLIADIRLPGGNGRDLAAELKRRHPRLRIVLMSGFGGENAEPEGKSPLGALFLPKPFRLGELIEVVRRALAAPEG